MNPWCLPGRVVQWPLTQVARWSSQGAFRLPLRGQLRWGRGPRRTVPFLIPVELRRPRAGREHQRRGSYRVDFGILVAAWHAHHRSGRCGSRACMPHRATARGRERAQRWVQRSGRANGPKRLALTPADDTRHPESSFIAPLRGSVVRVAPEAGRENRAEGARRPGARCGATTVRDPRGRLIRSRRGTGSVPVRAGRDRVDRPPLPPRRQEGRLRICPGRGRCPAPGAWLVTRAPSHLDTGPCGGRPHNREPRQRDPDS